MKILHILNERWDSGVTAYGLTVARVLKERGHEVWVSCLPESPTAEKATVLGLGLIPFRMVLSLWSDLSAQKFDVVNAHTGAGHTAGFVATRLNATALVRTRGEARRLTLRPGQDFLFNRTNAVIGASNALVEAYLTRFPLLRGRAFVVYPGVDRSSPVAPPPGPFRAGLLGRLDPVKGHRYFLDAIVQLKDRLTNEEFWVAGEEKNISKKELEKYAEERGISRWVRFWGPVQDAGKFMDNCHVGVIASVGSEAVSRVGMEWLSHGRPLVTTDVGALPEMVMSGDDGFVIPPKSASALARTLKSLMDDPSRREKMGERARLTADKMFSLQELGEKTEAVYRHAIKHRQG